MCPDRKREEVVTGRGGLLSVSGNFVWYVYKLSERPAAGNAPVQARQSISGSTVFRTGYFSLFGWIHCHRDGAEAFPEISNGKRFRIRRGPIRQ